MIQEDTMTVRTAELLMAITMALFSGYLMWKSTELNIGWVRGEGPGGGFWPFWLSTVMLACCGWILFNWFRKHGPIASSNAYFFQPGIAREVGAVAGLLALTVFLIDGFQFIGFAGIGFYGALPVFLFVYLKIYGGHSWLLTLLFVVFTPVLTFLFFEIALNITLPKGMLDPFFIEYIFPIFY